MIRERTKAGLAAARGLMADLAQLIAEACAAVRVSRATLYRDVPPATRRPALLPWPSAHSPQAVEPLAAAAIG